MSYLPRLYFYLTMIATILLAISLSDSNASPSAKATYEEFIKVEESCNLRDHPQTIRLGPKCRVTINSKRCIGYCRSLTDFELEQPYLTRECSCCKPNGTVTYIETELECYHKKAFTGVKVKVDVPHDMDCQCERCTRILHG